MLFLLKIQKTEEENAAKAKELGQQEKRPTAANVSNGGNDVSKEPKVFLTPPNYRTDEPFYINVREERHL